MRTDARPVGGRPDPAIKLATIVNPRGLHARAAAKFTKVANEFGAEISISHGGFTVSARSLMGLLMLGAGQGASITLAASGDDARPALEALTKLVADGFGET